MRELPWGVEVCRATDKWKFAGEKGQYKKENRRMAGSLCCFATFNDHLRLQLVLLLAGVI